MLTLALKRLSSLSVFERDWYLNQYPDTAAMDPARHAIFYGAKEGRRIFDPDKVAGCITKAPLLVRGGDVKKAISNIDVYVSSQGNVFMNEIADGLCDALRLGGVRVFRKNEITRDFFNSELKIVVAPHEFFFLNGGRNFFNAQFMQRCVVYNTEQFQTQWFSSALPEMLSAAAIVDICNQSASVLNSAGIPALHWEPTIKPSVTDLSTVAEHPLLKTLIINNKVTDWNKRSIDVSFFGAESSRRERALARIAPRIASLNSFIYYRRRSTPLSNGYDTGLTKVAEVVAQHSKVYLNIHRDVTPYFEWHRIAHQGIANNCVVISDECLEHPLYKPGVHYIQVNARHIGDAIDWVLNDPEGQQRAEAIRKANGSLLSSNKVEHSNAEDLLSFVSEFINAQ